MKKCFRLTFIVQSMLLLLYSFISISEAASCASLNFSPSSEEVSLHSMINRYREENGLHPVPLSRSLSYVAKTHVRDLQAYPPSGDCNLHSWSMHGEWTACCYTPDHARADCMWNKPGELTPFEGNGFEIAASVGGREMDASTALRSWQGSPGHNAVILNLDVWGGYAWSSMGIGIHGSYAVVWFALENDPCGYFDPSNGYDDIGNLPPNAPVILSPGTIYDSVDWTSRIDPTVTFRWRLNGDPDGDPVDSYLMLYAWDGQAWRQDFADPVNGQELTLELEPSTYYGWCVYAVDWDQNSEPWYTSTEYYFFSTSNDTVHTVETEYRKLIAKHSGKCLNVSFASHIAGANVEQSNCDGTDSQRFKLEEAGNGYYRIVAKHSQQCMDVEGFGMDAGTGVLQWHCHGGDNQLWRLE